jgi:hypothetical protein
MAKHLNAAILVCLSVVIFLEGSARADYVNLTGAENARNIAEIRVENDRVKVTLEVFVEDLGKFLEILPDEFFEGSDVKPPPIAARMQRFSEETFRVTADGEVLQATLLLSEPRMRIKRDSPFAGMINPYTRQRIPGAPEDPRVLYAEIVYPFTGQPEKLEFFPPRDKQGRPAASIGFVTWHRGVTVNDFRFLSEKATLSLDWEDPWYSRFEQKPYKRWQEAGVRAFFYIEPYEVRYEILARVKDLSAWVDLGLRDPDVIEADEFESLKERIGAFFIENDKVLIDGKEHRPVLDRVTFVKYTLTRTIFIEKPEKMPVETALVGVIITYITEGIPQEVTTEWNHFSDRVRKVPTNAVDPAGPFPSYVTPDDRAFTWTNYLKTYTIPTAVEIGVDPELTSFGLPVGSLLCLVVLLPVGFGMRARRRNGRGIGVQAGLGAALVAGSVLLLPYLHVPVAKPAAMAPKVEDERAVEILHGLLRNVYRSFDFREEEDVYDRLAKSVSGDLLEEIYLQNRRSFEVQRAGGARAKVKEVEILDVAVEGHPDRPLAYVFNAEWTAMGEVGHWGHIHMRQNRYRADITAEPLAGAWRITGLELIEEERIDPYAQGPGRQPGGGGP